MTAPSERVPQRRATSYRRHEVLPRGFTRESRIAALLVLFALGITLAVTVFTEYFPFAALMLPLLIGSIYLGPRQLPWFVVFIMTMVAISVAQQDQITARIMVSVAVQFLMGGIVLVSSFRRSRLGVAGTMGESMLVDLRDRILKQGGIPALPSGWQIESALRSAGGTPFAGDFVVASRPHGTDRLEVAVVDVSGKGEQAGTRALLLSGALGGLLGAVSPQRFVHAANEYLLQQDWEEGFATLIHFSLDLVSGSYEIRTAGHPPAAHRASGSGRWTVLNGEGPVLGLIEDAEFSSVSGVLRRGDAVLLYTDGMVEEPRRDIDLGIDRMLGEAEALLRGDFTGAADRLVDALGSRNDDRAMLVVSRR